MYKIRFCEKDKIRELQLFIRSHWKKEHIFAKDKKLLKWQHWDNKKKRLNFIAAFDSKTGDIVAILGIIPTSHYDIKLKDEKDFWMAIWKVRDENIKQGLGVKLLAYLEKEYRPNSLAAIGISGIAKKIYTILGFKTGKLAHYYFLNPHMVNYKIAKASCPTTGKFTKSLFSLSIINDLSKKEKFAGNMRPKKTIEYLMNRYARHPVYAYDFYGIFLSGKLTAIFVIREITVNKARCLRIVDIAGDINKVTSIETEMERLLVQRKAEFIDCLNYGIPESFFHNMGFLTRTDNIIIPNYFEPFERRNVDIDFAYKTKRENYIIFKGDSDQDRPSIV